MTTRTAIDEAVQEALDIINGEKRHKIKGYDYKVSNFGRIRSIDRNIIDANGNKRFVFGQDMVLSRTNEGFLKVNLSSPTGKRKSIMVSRIVYAYFVSRINISYTSPYVLHIDGDLDNNRWDNLRLYNGDYKNMNGKARNILRYLMQHGYTQDDILSLVTTKNEGHDYMYYIDKFFMHDNTERSLEDITLKEYLQFCQKL